MKRDRKSYENNWSKKITKEKQESEKLAAIPDPISRNLADSLENVSPLIKKEKIT